MKLFSTVIGTLALIATLVPARAHAQGAFDLRPDLTKAQFEELTASSDRCCASANSAILRPWGAATSISARCSAICP